MNYFFLNKKLEFRVIEIPNILSIFELAPYLRGDESMFFVGSSLKLLIIDKSLRLAFTLHYMENFYQENLHTGEMMDKLLGLI